MALIETLMLPVRVIQAVLAIIVLGLLAYGKFFKIPSKSSY